VLAADRARARARFGIDPAARAVLIMGGSQGARSLNFAAVEAFAESEAAAGREFDVLQLAGRRDYAELCSRLDTAPHRERYALLEYEPDLGDVLAASDLVVARSGGSVFEVTAAGRPSILVPFPHATADHQTENARWLERGGAATVLADAELTPARLAAEVAALLGDPARLEAMAAAAAAMAKPDAARRIADQVLAAAWLSFGPDSGPKDNRNLAGGPKDNHGAGDGGG
jgi:UDP-N-acetylglucosamine--N-acetylmuramyl-(pentapeptide) pyrophosphoryl-undecaprenol N-acetylglucosamine transferase